MGTKAGMPDFLFIWHAPFGIELKAPGGSPSKAQKETKEVWRRFRVQIHYASSIEEVREILDRYTIPRRDTALFPPPPPPPPPPASSSQS